MNEEEKKAVEFIRDLITWDVRQYLCPNKEECKNLEIILNLIEKRQKEIEKLKRYKKAYENGEYTWKQKYEETFDYVKENYIPVEKVKDKIKKLNYVSNAEELEDTMDGRNYTITELVQYVLQELLESEE